MTIPEMIMYTIIFILVFGALMGLAWHDGFEQGRSAANRKHVKQWCRLRNENRHLNEQFIGQDNRIDGIEARLAKLEHPDYNVLYADGKPCAVFPDIESLHPDINPKTTFNGYKFRCEPEMDDICKSCTRQGTSICYGCGYDHVFYDKNTEKPEDWDCDTCVNDGDMSHLQCRYCHEGSCYVKKEEPLKFDPEPSGEVAGTVTDIEDTGRGMRIHIKPVDDYLASGVDTTSLFDNTAVKPDEEVEVKED